MGKRRMRLPVAAKIAFTTAEAMGGVDTFPAPPGFSVLGTGTDRNGPTADRSADREREDGAPSLAPGMYFRLLLIENPKWKSRIKLVIYLSSEVLSTTSLYR